MTYPHAQMPLDELCDHLHHQGAMWLSNPNLLLLEELIRRAKQKESENGKGNSGPVHTPAGAADIRNRDAGSPTRDAD